MLIVAMAKVADNVLQLQACWTTILANPALSE
jgi:hypothetical protein